MKLEPVLERNMKKYLYLSIAALMMISVYAAPASAAVKVIQYARRL